MNIRTMTLADYEEAFALWTATPGMGMRSLDDSADGIAGFLRRNPTTCFVAEEAGALAGTILCGHDGRRGYIYHLLVRPDLRRSGTGRALVEQALAALRAEGIKKVALVAFASNKTGNHFWQAMGFEERGDLVYRNRSIDCNNH